LTKFIENIKIMRIRNA